jgi:hypothetical protein
LLTSSDKRMMCHFQGKKRSKDNAILKNRAWLLKQKSTVSIQVVLLLLLPGVKKQIMIVLLLERLQRLSSQQPPHSVTSRPAPSFLADCQKAPQTERGEEQKTCQGQETRRRLLFWMV